MDKIERKVKIFVSYTTLDDNINLDFLANVNSKLEAFSKPYIDLLHNNSKNKQERVIRELMNSDFLFLFKSDKIEHSIWVQKEIEIASKTNIPIIQIDFHSFENQFYDFKLKHTKIG